VKSAVISITLEPYSFLDSRYNALQYYPKDESLTGKSFAQRWGMVISIIILLVLFFVTGLYRYVSLSALQQHHQILFDWISQHILLAVLLFIAAYIVAVAISIPGATILTIAGGFLFGIIGGSLLVILSATIGALVTFVAVRTALADILRQKVGKRVQKMEKSFRNNAVSYMLFLRLVPVFPFWLINIAAGALDVRFSTYTWTTLVGIVPGSVVYVAVGNGMSEVIAHSNQIDLRIIFQPVILVPLVGLAILSLIPIVYHRFKQQHGS